MEKNSISGAAAHIRVVRPFGYAPHRLLSEKALRLHMCVELPRFGDIVEIIIRKILHACINN